ncbi:MAG: nucleotidyl transferase AbiEii/AbiGii toxin family protein [Novosphingobium sp.]
MDEFARRPADERRAFFDEAAARRDLTPLIVEKDFWVCWTLRRLMRVPELAGVLTFKGGTSLSKAFGIIKRFSEDIDLTINRAAPLLGEVASPMASEISGKERERRGKALSAAAQEWVATILLPTLAQAIEEVLGTREGWSIEADPDDRDLQTVLFNYPASSGYGLDYGTNYGGHTGYVQPRIKLEFGARGDPEPVEQRDILPYVAEDFPGEVPDAVTAVPTLALERTYWEKVTILHALHHSGKLRPGLSRHYYDVFMLDAAGVTERALAQRELLEQVVRNKSLLFADAKASYGTAQLGTLRLAVTDAMRDELAADYAAMAEMFMEVPPKFEELVSRLADLEARINAAG